jgi:hypothetical protein
MTEIDAGIRLTAKNQTDQAFNDFERNVRRSTSVAQQQFELVNKQMRNTGIALTAVATGGAALITKSTLLAARVETLGVVMQQVGKNAGFSAAEMSDFEKGVREMGITTQVARTSLIRLIQANIDLSKSSELARLAQDAAVIAGINSSEAFERMVHGINTLNPRVLKTMGLVISLEQGYANYAKQMGITTNEIDTATKKQIAVNLVLEAGTRIAGSYEAAMDTAGKRMTSIARHAEEAERAFGEAFLPAFVLVIDATTAAFKAFNDLNPALQRTAAFSIAAGTAIAGMVGPLLILASQGPRIATSMANVGSVFFSLGPNIAALGTKAGFATTAIAGLAPALGALVTAAVAATAVLALAVAIGVLLQTLSDLGEKQKTLIEVANEHAKEMREAGRSFEFYDKEMRRVIRDVGMFNLGAKEFTKLLREGGEEAVAAAVGIELWDESVFNAIRSGEELGEIMGEDAKLLGTYADEAEVAARQSEKLEAALEIVKGGMERLHAIMSTTVSADFDEMKAQQGALIGSIDEMQERIVALASINYVAPDQEQQLIDAVEGFLLAREEIEGYEDLIQRLGLEPFLTEEQRALLAETRTLLTDVKGDAAGFMGVIQDIGGLRYLSPEQQDELGRLLEGVDAAEEQIGGLADEWDRATKAMIFSLAEAALGPMLEEGSEEAFSALAKLAGPEGMGLVDEGGQALIEAIAGAAGEMTTAGDQSGLFVDALKTLQSEGLDPAQESGQELVDTIAKLESKEITIDVAFNVQGSLPRGDVYLEQRGGPFQFGKWNLIGEAGAELVTPWGQVLDAATTRKMMEGNRLRPRRLQEGGLLPFQQAGQFDFLSASAGAGSAPAADVAAAGDNITLIINDRPSAALAMALIEERRHERLGRAMGA